MPKTDERLLGFAKELRREMTPAEARLWYHLRAKRLNGVKFVRQSVRRHYIADFLARSHQLVIEIDGDTHDAPRPMTNAAPAGWWQMDTAFSALPTPT